MTLKKLETRTTPLVGHIFQARNVLTRCALCGSFSVFKGLVRAAPWHLHISASMVGKVTFSTFTAYALALGETRS